MSRALGAKAEARAAEFLARKRFRILHRNWTCRGGELDLVCEDGEVLVFVEVRARRDDRHGSPLETIGALKRRRLLWAAKQYLASQGLWERACRFDVVAVAGEEIEHLADAFTA